MAESIVTPAIRTPLLALDDPAGGSAGRSPIRTPAPTTKDWWLYWDALTRGTNKNTGDIAALAAQLDATIRAGTHAERLAEPPAPPEALWIVTDRDNVVYQVQLVAGSPAWVYVAGTMTGSFSELPSGLGANDVNFTFATSDTLQVYRWSGSTWVNQTPAPIYLFAAGTGAALALTTTPTAVPSLSVTLPLAGRYAIRATVDLLQAGAGDQFSVLVGRITFNSTPAGAVIVWQTPTGGSNRATLGNEWDYTASAAGVVVTVEVSKSTGTGTSVCFSTNSRLSATRVGP